MEELKNKNKIINEYAKIIHSAQKSMKSYLVKIRNIWNY